MLDSEHRRLRGSWNSRSPASLRCTIQIGSWWLPSTTSPDSVAFLDNCVYAMTDQGVISLFPGSQPQNLSISIDTPLQQLMNSKSLGNFQSNSIGPETGSHFLG